MTTFLLIAILIMTGWIMITLNEIDRTNHSLIHDTNLNQGKIMQNQQLILDSIKRLSGDIRRQDKQLQHISSMIVAK